MGDDESCETATASVCTTYLSYGVDTEGTTTTTATASLCTENIGCSASGVATTSATTVTSTPSSVPYVIYPVDGTNSAQVAQIASLLISLRVPTSLPYYVSQSSQGLGVSFWYAVLTPAQVDALASNNYVSTKSNIT
jgi:hypothetical protein